MTRYSDAHRIPKGAGDERPTAKQIVEDEGLVGKLSDKVFLVTGCSSGIGIETARALHETGAHLFLTARDAKKLEAVKADILQARGAGKIDLLHLDLSSLKSVRQCAEAFLAKSKQLNALVLNAGVMASPEGKTEDGFETQFGTNHLGHFLLFQLLQPTLLSSSTPAFNSRVVILSSSNHRISGIQFNDLDLKKVGYEPFKAYGQSKTANVYMANEIDRRYGAKGLHATSVHPGGIATTELIRHMDPALMQSMLTDHTTSHLKSAEQGCATTVWATISRDWEGKGGKYLEDCQVGEPHDPDAADAQQPLASGYAPHAYDAAKEKRLWDESLQLVGLA